MDILQETNISHLGKKKIIFKGAMVGRNYSMNDAPVALQSLFIIWPIVQHPAGCLFVCHTRYRKKHLFSQIRSILESNYTTCFSCETMATKYGNPLPPPFRCFGKRSKGASGAMLSPAGAGTVFVGQHGSGGVKWCPKKLVVHWLDGWNLVNLVEGKLKFLWM